MNFLKKPFVYAIIFTVLLTSLNIYILLKTFIISDAIEIIDTENASTSSNDNIINEDNIINTEVNEKIITENSYEDENIKISIDTIYRENTYVYVVDIEISSAEYLKTALANNTYGNNVTQTTSEIAKANNAILAINGDYYGANAKGYVIKNGTLFRATVRSDTDNDDLVIYKDGTFEIINEKDISAEELIEKGVVNNFAFGPTLVLDGEIVVSKNDEVAKSKSDNPRTAIGIIDDLHYIFLVSDGRTDENEGLTLYQVAEIMEEYGCTTSYNLDGGGSSTLYFNGNIINNPTTSGKTIKERAVSDIVYIGY